jgi:hypothetical protein
MKEVLFVQLVSPYNIGEIACFSDEEAQRLVFNGLARYVENKIVTEPEVSKMVEAPPKDKMMRSAKVKKK